MADPGGKKKKGVDSHATTSGTANDPYDLSSDAEVKEIVENLRSEAEKEEKLASEEEVRAMIQTVNLMAKEEAREKGLNKVPKEIKDDIIEEPPEKGEQEMSKRQKNRKIRHAKSSQRKEADKKKPPLTEDEKRKIRRKRVCRFFVLIALLVAPAMAAFYHFIFAEKNQDDVPRKSQPTRSPSKRPTYVPSASPTLLPTFRGETFEPSSEPTKAPSQQPTGDVSLPLLSFLQKDYGIDVTSGQSTAVGKAIDWLVNEALFESTTEVGLSPKLFQRFVLLVTYYSLSTEESENTFDEQRQKNGFFNNFRSSNAVVWPNWGMRNQDECLWPGVSCNDVGNVNEIKLGDKNIDGNIATELGSLTDLVHLDLSNNKIHGPIPEEIYDLTNLEQLFLYDNQLTGTISTKIGNLLKLTHYQVSQNQLNGTIPKTLKSRGETVRPLRYFNVQRNQLTGTIPSNLRLRKLYYVDLGRNMLSGTVPDELGEQLVRVRHLYLDHNQFSGTIPYWIMNAGDGHLRNLALNDNKFTGDLPGDHMEIRKMDQLTVQNNKLDGMSKNTCSMSVFVEGEMIEFKSDCDICRCSGFMCRFCTE